MKVGDLVRHRNRKTDDPQPTNEFRDTWGENGIVLHLCYASWEPRGLQKAVQYMNNMGDIILAPEKDLVIMNRE